MLYLKHESIFMINEEKTFTVKLERIENYKFRIDFENKNWPFIVMDESPPNGNEKGPNPSSVLAAAIGDCLSASLLFCLQKSHVNVEGIKTIIKGKMNRNEKGRWRVTEISTALNTDISLDTIPQLKRCAKIFEDFCIVSKSVEQGIPINIKVSF